MSKNIRASILTLGCRVNQYESDAIMQELAKITLLKKSLNIGVDLLEKEVE